MISRRNWYAIVVARVVLGIGLIIGLLYITSGSRLWVKVLSDIVVVALAVWLFAAGPITYGKHVEFQRKIDNFEGKRTSKDRVR